MADLSKLPSVHALVEAARALVAERRAALLAGETTDAAIEPAAVVARATPEPSLRRVINATGVVLHTNLGRAPLAAAARAAIDEAAAGYTNLEYDLAAGARGSRHVHLRATLRALTGAEDAICVNNNAAATVLGLAALAQDREVIVSRGELIEIGGSFRLPEILALSRGAMVEVGTTNKTHAADYTRAVTPKTGVLLKVHRSNFALVGFTAEVAIAELVAIGRAHGVPVMVDLGSGALLPREAQRALGLPEEPTVREVVAAGADLVTFSGDKLLGGPQAGLVVGSHAAVERARKHPLMRALRPDKLTIAGLAATLDLYRHDRASEVPAVAMLAKPLADLEATARALAAEVGGAVEPCTSTVGGGAMPTAALPSFAVTLRGEPTRLEARLRAAGIVARVEADRVWLDVRTIASDEHAAIIRAIHHD